MFWARELEDWIVVPYVIPSIVPQPSIIYSCTFLNQKQWLHICNIQRQMELHTPLFIM